VQATTRYRRGDGLESASWFFLTRVDVHAPADTRAIVAIGDSLTDGTASGLDANRRWPDHLAKRLVDAGLRVSVLNAGIGGNRILAEGNGPAALARFERDVLAQPGVAAVIVFEGINDIGQARANPAPSAADVIDAYKQMIARARARGLRIVGVTLTPFQGANYWTPEGEAKRRQINDWIRTSGAYDIVVDADAVVRDPDNPATLRRAFDPGDHLHLNAAGYAAVADAIDLSTLTAAVRR
jgi:lysophospholipase L1-like esterase